MKELSIEEKAKAYDEALEKAQKWCANTNEGYRSIFEDIFPELKESEDERIRKALIEMVHDTTGDELWVDYNVHKEDALAWLEKQGEQNYKIIKGKNYFCIKTHNYAGVKWIKGTKYYASDNYTLVNQGCECYCPEYSKEEHNNLFEEVKYDGCVEKQGEQKSIDDLTQQEAMDIAVAKCFEQGKQKPQRMISAEAKEAMYDKPACAWSDEDDVAINRIVACLENLNVADNDILLKDVDWLKSLKDRVQPQSKQEWSDVDKDILFRIIDDLKFLKEDVSVDSNYAVNIIDMERKINWLKSLKGRVRPKQEWSEEDEHRIKDTVYFLDTAKKHYASTEELDACIDWLKSLKERLSKQTE